MGRMNCPCGGQLIVLETFCTDPYQKTLLKLTKGYWHDPQTNETFTPAVEESLDWFRDIKKRCVCSRCGKKQEVLVKTVKQDRQFK